jgi:DNA-directed RNA polymerase subunit beta
MPQPRKLGNKTRMFFSNVEAKIERPNLIQIQKKSYDWFLEEGLMEAFEDISPIKDYTDSLILEFIDYEFEKETKYSMYECKDRDVSYARSMYAKVRFINMETGEVKEQRVFMGDFPKMTYKGTFIINGAERVIVSQLVRSPAPYFSLEYDKKSGLELYSATIIPNRGTWLEYETNARNVFAIRIDRTRKMPITVFLRAMGLETDQEIFDMFGEDEKMLKTIEKDKTTNREEALIEIYKKIRPGEPPSVDSADSLLKSMFFDPKRYDLARVGRFKFNQKLGLVSRIINRVIVNDAVDSNTGEIILEKGKSVTRETAIEMENRGICRLVVKGDRGEDVKIVSNNFVDANYYLDNAKELRLRERVYYPVLREILDTCETKEEIDKAIKERYRELIPKNLILADIFASVSYGFNLNHGVGRIDDIDHLGNRRIRAVGELLQNQFRIGLSRMERVIRERMTIKDMEAITPHKLINIKPVVAAINEFFGSSQLSQFMDQTNALSELTHKRRLSALGPGGLSRERAGFEVRDIHYSHYGRMCPIETPEGPNIGLIGALSTFAKLNQYGFISTPYMNYNKATGIIEQDNIEYMSADIEDGSVVVPANEPVEDNKFVKEKVVGRKLSDVAQFRVQDVDLVEVSPQQMISVSTALIPFLENDDANRALMGANMQRQAVPLMRPQAPIIGTGMEYIVAHDSGMVELAENDGVVDYVSADKIVIRKDSDNSKEVHRLIKFRRSNQGTTLNQKPVVSKGQIIKADHSLTGSYSIDDGELAIGTNMMIGFMVWDGYNFEDAVLISENIVKHDKLTSIHIEEYELEARDTKLGSEEITREIPNVSEKALKDLDERGIIRIGAEVNPGDFLVGKVTPKGETELTAEERLLRAIFGEKAREVRDNSLKVSNGQNGIVVDVKVFDRGNGDDLAPGINTLIRVYVAKKRKIRVGDKIAGRHGNKGVISMVLPEEDMPFTEDGTPLEILLNPLGVPSRMNIGQVLEVHLGLVAKKRGWLIATEAFDGAEEDQIIRLLGESGLPTDGKLRLRDGRTGEFFDNKVTVGYMYILKLHHLVDNKLHARATGPYSLVTQQPLGGKAQFGGQRFGEMEVWALEAYGAAHTLEELLTIKSDDVVGRVKAYEAIVKGENIPKPGIPESFKVLIKEFQSLCLKVELIRDKKDEEIEINVGEKLFVGDEEKQENVYGNINSNTANNNEKTNDDEFDDVEVEIEEFEE